MATKVPKSKDEQIGANEAKWGKTTMAAGWTAVPNILLERQSTLGISPTQLNILMIIFKHWWEHDNLPFPEMNTIAAAMGVSRSTVQRNIRVLEQLGLINRIYRKAKHGGNTSNQYDFDKLVKLLAAYAKDEIAHKEKGKEAKKKRLTPKGNKPALKVVSSS
ncbi:hypothetical protein LCGC14_0827260 [marine sediment metagenome]|uniref:Helix-turn-helix domain-containing protein n=1 Tax=marine sediment metagenome TaxID=412755 RepID=A0A0F9SPE6_9ZZZZ